MTQRPSVYLDTSFVSMLFLRGRDVRNVGRHMMSREWWEDEAASFLVFSSRFTEAELAQGDYRWKEKAIGFVRRLRYLPRTREVEVCAELLLDEGIVPDAKRGDAAQLAIATTHRMDYLMSWNHAHLVNPQVQDRMQRLCAKLGWRCPWLVNPETIPKARLGHRLSRRD